MATSAKTRSILDAAMARLKKCVEADAHNRDAAIEDLEFANGDQWPEAERVRRTQAGRPMLQIDLLSKYIDQVVGDMLHNVQTIKVRPDDSKADIEIAKIRQGIINQITYKSNFTGIKKYAGRQQVTCGHGAWRVLTRYTEENPFLQEAYIASVRNPFLVYIDPDAREPFGADAKYGFILEKVNQEDFKARYPKGKWPTETLDVGPGLGMEHWYDGDTVTVAEYFTVEPQEQVMLQLETGEVVTQEQYDEKLALWQERNAKLLAKIPAAVGNSAPGLPSGAPQMPPPHLSAPPQAGGAGPQPVQTSPYMVGGLQAEIEALGPQPRVVNSRKTKKNVLRHRVITAYEILEGGEEGKKFPGKFIPLVQLKGKELNIEGKNYIYGLIRRAKDAQKSFNYWYCLDTNTPIPTPNGWKLMRDLEPGDVVFGDDGRPCNVIGISPTHEGRPCYEITFDDGSTIITDDSHLWVVDEKKHEKYTRKKLKTTELLPKKHFITSTKPLELPDADLPIDPYVLGVWLGDGDSAGGRITVGKDDAQDMVRCLEQAGESVNVTTDKRWDVKYIRVDGLTARLKRLGVFGKKHVPPEYLRASLRQRQALLQGMMDTDGSIDRKFQCSFTTTSSVLADAFWELTRSLGIKAKMFLRPGKEKVVRGRLASCKPQAQFAFTSPVDMPVFRLGRKAAIQAKKTANHERRTKAYKVVSVVSVPSVPTKCIAVDNDSHLFLAGRSMVPTHNTAAAEYIALAPKAPWIGTAKQFEGYEKDYAAANVENFPFLKYNADPDAPGPPQRTGAPQVPEAIFVQIQRAEELVKSTIGLFNADVGAPGSEQTGAAILARQRPGDVGAYEFSVNMTAAVEYTGRILNEIIPEIYDSERDVRLRFHDETETFTPINTTLGAAADAVRGNPEAYKGLDAAKLGTMLAKEGRSARFNDITVGKYDVVVTTGPSYSTQRQEASHALLMLMQTAPQQMSIALDLVAKNLDFKDADELEARLRKPLLAQGLIKPRAGEEVQPPPPDPKAQAEMAQAQARVQSAQLAVERESLQVQEATLRLQAEVAKIQAETGRKLDTTILDAIEKERKHAIEAARVRMEQERLEHERMTDRMDIALRASEQFNRRKTQGGK